MKLVEYKNNFSEIIKKLVTKKNIVILLICIIGIILSYLFLPTFRMKNIEILGNSSYTDKNLFNLTKENFNKNIYLINKRKIRDDLLKSPYLKTVDIKPKFPNTLVFNIIERTPVATIKFSGGFAIIDDNAFVLETTSDIDKIKKPLISGIDIKNLVLGEKLLQDDNKLDFSMKIISSIQSAKLLNNVSMIDISNLEDIKIITPQGINVLIGSGENLNENMLVLNKILINLFERGIYSGYIDMRFNSYPVYRSKK